MFSPQLPAGAPVWVIVLASVRFACDDLGVADDLLAAVTTGGDASFTAMAARVVCVLRTAVRIASA